MPDCDYCERAFDDEAEYAAHLRDEHGSELGPIDRRRTAQLDSDGRDLPIGLVAIAVVGLVAVGVVAYVTLFAGGSGGGDVEGLEGEPLPEHGNESQSSDVQTYPSQGNEHVDSGTDVKYSTMPPTSGPHYGQAASAGYYTETPPLGQLVHSLEHGAVVIYYDPARSSPAANESLQKFAQEHTGTWQSVIVVPNPQENPESTYVLTAWQHMLRMNSYDKRTVRAFLAEYLGRGPENPVR